ncbi:MAG: SDR family NAD(P)-dependent oxidoreductase, partial [Myxococcales bacterium]|nr:SDR family NAD(P)-dependent oxidoreductase [Myxococcales bacterium]
MSVLILGATSPIARQLGVRYAQLGQPVFCAARDAQEAAAIAADLRVRFQVQSGSAAFDARDLDSHPGLIAQVEDALGPLDVVVVAFGDMGDEDAAPDDPGQVRRVIEVNFSGAASLCEAAAARMTER